MCHPGKNLFVCAFFITHQKDTQWTTGDNTSTERRVTPDDKNIKRVTISTHRSGNPTVVKWVEEWAVEWTIQAENAMLTVIFVLVR
jgi:hypothetical protein